MHQRKGDAQLRYKTNVWFNTDDKAIPVAPLNSPASYRSDLGSFFLVAKRANHVTGVKSGMSSVVVALPVMMLSGAFNPGHLSTYTDMLALAIVSYFLALVVVHMALPRPQHLLEPVDLKQRYSAVLTEMWEINSTPEELIYYPYLLRNNDDEESDGVLGEWKGHRFTESLEALRLEPNLDSPEARFHMLRVVNQWGEEKRRCHILRDLDDPDLNSQVNAEYAALQHRAAQILAFHPDVEDADRYFASLLPVEEQALYVRDGSIKQKDYRPEGCQDTLEELKRVALGSTSYHARTGVGREITQDMMLHYREMLQGTPTLPGGEVAPRDVVALERRAAQEAWDELGMKILEVETDWETMLYMPLIRNPNTPATGRFYEAWGKLGDALSSPEPRSDMGVLAGEAREAWEEAVAYAQKVGIPGASASDKSRLRKLGDLAYGDEGTQGERDSSRMKLEEQLRVLLPSSVPVQEHLRGAAQALNGGAAEISR